MPCHHSMSPLTWQKATWGHREGQKTWQIQSDRLTNVSMKRNRVKKTGSMWIQVGVLPVFSRFFKILFNKMYTNFTDEEKKKTFCILGCFVYTDTKMELKGLLTFLIHLSHVCRKNNVCLCITQCLCYVNSHSHAYEVNYSRPCCLYTVTFPWLELLPWHFPSVRSILI